MNRGCKKSYVDAVTPKSMTTKTTQEIRKKRNEIQKLKSVCCTTGETPQEYREHLRVRTELWERCKNAYIKN